MPRHSDAEGILQDTSVVLWKKFCDFRTGTDFFRWSAQVARYKVQEYRKKAARDRHLFWRDDLIEAIAETCFASNDELMELRTFLAQCVRSLNAIDRGLILQCFEGKCTIKAVAEYIGKPVNTVYKALNRIRKSLMDCIEKARLHKRHGG